MLVKYRSCDGETIVVEPITKLEVFQSLLPPHELFMRCHRPDGDYFELYDLGDLDEVREG